MDKAEVFIKNPDGTFALSAQSRRDDTVEVSLWYPNINPVKHIEIELMDVRASDGFRTHYDFHRDGWVIEQASTFSWESDDELCDPDWQEVFFVKSWARAKPGTFEESKPCSTP